MEAVAHIGWQRSAEKGRPLAFLVGGHSKNLIKRLRGTAEAVVLFSAGINPLDPPSSWDTKVDRRRGAFNIPMGKQIWRPAPSSGGSEFANWGWQLGENSKTELSRDFSYACHFGKSSVCSFGFNYWPVHDGGIFFGQLLGPPSITV